MAKDGVQDQAIYQQREENRWGYGRYHDISRNEDVKYSVTIVTMLPFGRIVKANGFGIWKCLHC